MKLELLGMLRQEDIYVWERGAIEAYCPPLETNEPNNKLDRARRFCERYATAGDIRGLPVFEETDDCKFDLIFEGFFGSSAPQPVVVELPLQEAAHARGPHQWNSADLTPGSPLRERHHTICVRRRGTPTGQ
jgi:hypothetical protein